MRKKTFKKFAKILGKNNYLVIGVDIRKDIKIMEKAYNDSQGLLLNSIKISY